MINLRLPNITANNTEGQIAQIKSAMIQLTEQLNFAFNTISNGESMKDYSKKETASSGSGEGTNNTFSQLKSLIIKSADTVEHTYDELVTLFDQNDKYVATSAFGTYKSEQNSKMEALPDVLKTTFYTKEEIDDEYGERIEKLENNALIKQGVLRFFTAGEYEGVPQYGIEVGQEITNDDGEVIYNKMARMFAEGLELYTSNNSNTPTAIFKYNTMYITNAEVSGTLKLGGYKISTTNGLTFKWAGRSE